ncbi:MAG TPA: cytochrome c [Candidatus Sulfotelmatobacter sp.]|nr:cytochrome c [Candidatus Sulfotelmatobacter sp.]
MKRGQIVLVVLVLLAGTAIAAGALILHDGLSARATPSALEAFFAQRAHRLSIPSNARNMHNPMPASDENLKAARDHFADHCSSCHGNDGSGDTMYGKGLYPKPPDLRQQETQNLSDGELFWIIENGVRFTGMPAFGGHGSEDDSWKLVLFIRHLPQLHDQERLEMEKMNPKGPNDRDEDQDEQDFLKGEPVQQKAPAKHH